MSVRKFLLALVFCSLAAVAGAQSYAPPGWADQFTLDEHAGREPCQLLVEGRPEEEGARPGREIATQGNGLVIEKQAVQEQGASLMGGASGGLAW